MRKIAISNSFPLKVRVANYQRDHNLQLYSTWIAYTPEESTRFIPITFGSVQGSFGDQGNCTIQEVWVVILLEVVLLIQSTGVIKSRMVPIKALVSHLMTLARSPELTINSKEVLLECPAETSIPVSICSVSMSVPGHGSSLTERNMKIYRKK